MLGLTYVQYFYYKTHVLFSANQWWNHGLMIMQGDWDMWCSSSNYSEWKWDVNPPLMMCEYLRSTLQWCCANMWYLNSSDAVWKCDVHPPICVMASLWICYVHSPICVIASLRICNVHPPVLVCEYVMSTLLLVWWPPCELVMSSAKL